MSMFITKEPVWQHKDDDSVCEIGLGNVPLNQWFNVAIPLACADNREIRPKVSDVFWVDDIDIKDMEYVSSLQPG